MAEIKDLEGGLAIDENALEEECARHPQLYYEVSKNLVIWIDARDTAKRKLEETEARVERSIRRDAEHADEKMTNPQVESEKRLHKDVMSATDEFLEMKLLVGEWTALKEAFEQRSYALNHLVDLHMKNYYNGTVGEGNHRRATEERANKAREEMSRMRRKAHE